MLCHAAWLPCCHVATLPRGLRCPYHRMYVSYTMFYDASSFLSLKLFVVLNLASGVFPALIFRGFLQFLGRTSVFHLAEARLVPQRQLAPNPHVPFVPARLFNHQSSSIINLNVVNRLLVFCLLFVGVLFMLLAFCLHFACCLLLLRILVKPWRVKTPK